MDDFQTPEYSDFKEALVAFVDVLGFSHVASAIHDEQSFLAVANLVAALKVQAERYNANRESLANVSMTAVSDSVIFSIPYREPTCAFSLMTMVHILQYDLIATNFRTLIRGYIAKGPVFHRDGLIFGSGYLDAYHGEQRVGGPPRVVVDQEVVRLARRAVEVNKKPDMVSVFTLLREDPADGCYFIDYLKPIGPPASQNAAVHAKERQEIAAFVDDALRHFARGGSIHSKYQWLRDYLRCTDEILS